MAVTALRRAVLTFFHPDYTVGSRFSLNPADLRQLAGLERTLITAGRELRFAHPAPKVFYLVKADYSDRAGKVKYFLPPSAPSAGRRADAHANETLPDGRVGHS